MKDKFKYFLSVLPLFLFVFFLCSFTVKADEITLADPYPSIYPMQPSWDYTPWINNTVAQQSIISEVDSWINSTSLSDKKYLLQMSRASGDGFDVYMYYNNPYPAIYPSAGTYLLDGWLNDTETRFGIVGVQVTFSFDSNGYLLHSPTYNHNSDNSFYNQYNGQKRSSVSLTRGGVNNRYIFYVSSAWTKLTNQSNVMVDTQEPSIVQYVEPFPPASEALDSIVPVTSEIATIAGDLTGSLADMSPNTLKGWFNSIIQELHNGTSYIASAFTSAFLPFWNNFKLFFDWIKSLSIWQTIEDIYTWLIERSPFAAIAEIVDNILDYGRVNGEFDFKFFLRNVFSLPTGEEIKAMFLQTELGIMFNTINTNMSDILNALMIDNIVVPDVLRFTIPYRIPTMWVDSPGQLMYLTGDIELNFAWYADIRDTYLSVLMPFLYCGFGIYILKALPGIIGGTSGFYHNVAETAFPPDKSKKEGS